MESHKYLDDNPTNTGSDNYSVSLTLSTAGGSDVESATVVVNNVSPTISNLVLNPSIVKAGEIATLSGIVSDAGTQDSQTIQIDWGDGSPVQMLNLAAGVSNFNASHQYNTTGNLTITVMATDDDGDTTSDTLVCMLQDRWV